METDRGAVLTIRAAVAGVIDFAQARLQDVSWWRRTNVLIRAMAVDREIEIMKAAYAFQCALVGNGSLTEDSFKTIQRGAKETFNEIANTLQPWAATSSEEIKQREISGLMEMYKQLVGDPDDETFMRRLEENARHLEEITRSEPKESEEQRITRLAQEYAQEREQRYAEAMKRG